MNMSVKSLIILFAVSISLLNATAQSVDSLKTLLTKARGAERVSLYNKLYLELNSSDPVQASAYNREALTLSLEIKDTLGIAKSYNNLGHIYRNHGALDQALEYYLISENLFRQINDSEGLGSVFNNIGTIYGYKQDHNQAKSYFEKAQEIFIQREDQVRLSGVLNNLGSTLMALGDQDLAMKFFEQAMAVGEQAGHESPDPLVNIGNLYLMRDDHEKAVEYLNHAAESARKLNNKESLLSIQIGLGNAWLKAGELAASEKSLKEALRLSEEVEAYILEPEIFKSLAANYARQGRMGDAYTNMLRYEEGRERFFSEESSRKIAQMEILIDIHEKEKELDALRREEEINRVKLHRSQLAITLIIVSLVTIALLANLYLQRKKSSRRK